MLALLVKVLIGPNQECQKLRGHVFRDSAQGMKMELKNAPDAAFDIRNLDIRVCVSVMSENSNF